uniref:CCR4-NOT transcription complex subunit 11 n=1 Tax=Trypanosoma congolense (strain IL3000) TaxID=1068625 RepID=G0URG8_TRYCI|nr:conserved hypothetical protein [Trypanosoma congolense IL3000]
MYVIFVSLRLILFEENVIIAPRAVQNNNIFSSVALVRWDMVVEYLASADVQRLLDLLSEGKVNFSAVEKEFKAIFSKDSFFNVSKTLQRLMHGMIASPEGIGLVSSFFILDVMCRMDCEAAKSSFYDALLELEKAIRQDVCIMEQIKYASKDTKEAKKAYESNSCEKYRLRSAVKSFAFRLLANKVTSDETPLTAITDKQEQIDAALNTWESNNVQLKESIAEVAHSWSQDTEKNACEALSRTSVVLDHRGHAALILKPSTPHLPSLALTSGELQFLLPSLSLNDLLLIHGDPPTEVWKTAKQMITAGCKGLLSKEDQHKLLQTLLSDDVFARVGINSALLSRMAEYNPDVAASLILMLSPHEANNCIQNILKSSIPSEHVETVLLHASRVLQQTSLRAYITNKLHYFKEKATLSSEDKDAVKNFIRTLHQLLTKASKDNKEIYVAEALKGDITRLCEKCDVPEVTARWDELK